MSERITQRGIECTSCHTVYFIGHPANRERIYYAARSAYSRSTRLHISINEISDLDTRTMVKNADFGISLSKNANLWTLLCICSHQVSFLKTELTWYVAPKATLERGYAIKGEWKEAQGIRA